MESPDDLTGHVQKMCRRGNLEEREDHRDPEKRAPLCRDRKALGQRIVQPQIGRVLRHGVMWLGHGGFPLPGKP